MPTVPPVSVPAHPLPDRPNLDLLRKLAKERLAAMRAAGNAPARLTDAQLAVAREYGFKSWRALKARVDAINRVSVETIVAFFDAIRRNDERMVLDMLRSRSELATVRDADGANAMGIAVEYNRPALVEALIDAGAEPEPVYSHAGHSPLSWALTVGAFDAAEALLRRGVEPDLFCAAGLGKLDAAESFFHGGKLRANASQTGSTRYADGKRLPCPPTSDREVVSDALYIACRNGRTDVTRFLLRHDPDLSFGAYMNGTPLHWAYFNGTPELIDLLLAAGADPTLRDDTFRCTPRAFGICVPASWGIEDLVRRCLQRDPSLVNTLDGRGTPLWEAARSGQLDMVRLLLRAGADPSRGTTEGQTPRQIADERGHAEVVRVLDEAAA